MIFRTHFRIPALLPGALILIGAVNQLPAGDLASTLARMDKAAVGFSGLTADIKSVSHTFIIKDTTEEAGRMTLQRPKPRDTRMLVEFTRPEPRALSFAGRKVQIFYPKINTVQEYDLGKQSSLIDQFLLLGFGSTSSELRAGYDIKYAGEGEAGGQMSDRLELTPKSAEARAHVNRIVLWISQSNGQPAQIQVFQPSKDYRLITYTRVALNPSLGKDAASLKLPKGVKRETPQK